MVRSVEVRGAGKEYGVEEMKEDALAVPEEHRDSMEDLAAGGMLDVLLIVTPSSDARSAVQRILLYMTRSKMAQPPRRQGEVEGEAVGCEAAGSGSALAQAGSELEGSQARELPEDSFRELDLNIVAYRNGVKREGSEEVTPAPEPPAKKVRRRASTVYAMRQMMMRNWSAASGAMCGTIPGAKVKGCTQGVRTARAEFSVKETMRRCSRIRNAWSFAQPVCQASEVYGESKKENLHYVLLLYVTKAHKNASRSLRWTRHVYEVKRRRYRTNT